MHYDVVSNLRFVKITESVMLISMSFIMKLVFILDQSANSGDISGAPRTEPRHVLPAAHGQGAAQPLVTAETVPPSARPVR